jgi:hypothetical protein
MSLLAYCAYSFSSFPYLTTSRGGLVIPASLGALVLVILRFCWGLQVSCLVEMGGYAYPRGVVVWYLFNRKITQGGVLLFIPSKVLPSCEVQFRNARWLEREVSEFFGIFFLQKRDRRALFSLPLFYGAPLQKWFPTGGLFELGVCVITFRLIFFALCWRS